MCSLLCLLLSLSVCPLIAGAYSSFFKCAYPPTIDTIDILSYSGKWYEISSSAIFKFESETGLACTQAQYGFISSAGGAATISVSNSGVLAASVSVLLFVNQIGSPLRSIFRSGSDVCKQQLASLSAGVAYFSNSSSSSAAAAFNAISVAVSTIKSSCDTISIEANNVAYTTGKLMQAQVPASDARSELQNSLTTINMYAQKIVATSKSIDSSISSVVLSTLSSSGQQVLTSVSSASSAVRAGGLNLDQAARNIILLSVSLIIPTPKIGPTGRSFFSARAQQDPRSKGKLTVNFPFTPVATRPNYWIIDLDGEASKGYNAALVYSCEETTNGRPVETVFVLARTPTLSAAITQKFSNSLHKSNVVSDFGNVPIASVQNCK